MTDVKKKGSTITSGLEITPGADVGPVVTPVEPSGGNGNGGTAAGFVPLDAPLVTDVTPPPLTPGAPDQPFPEMQVPLRPGRKAPTAPRGQTQAQSVLPDPWRIVLRKVMPNAEEAYVGNYTSAQVRAAGGDLESFIRTSLSGWIDPGLTRFRAYLKSPKGEEQPYGDVNVMGDPAAQGTTPTASANPVDDAMRMFQQAAQMQRDAETRARSAEAERREREETLMAQMKQMQDNRGGNDPMANMMGMMMLMRQMREDSPKPTVDPVMQQTIFESIVNRAVGPIVNEVNLIREQVRSTPPPMMPAPDPLESVSKLIAAMKPEHPSAPPMTPMDVINLLREAQPKTEGFNLKDMIALLPVIREALGVSRMEAELSRSNDRMEKLMTQPQRGLSDTLNEVKALREVKDLFGDSGGGGTAIDRIFSPEGFQAASQLIDALRGNASGGVADDEDENIEVTDKSPSKPQPKRPRPSDFLAIDTYPDGFADVVNKLAAAGANEPADDKEKMRLVIALMKSLQFLAFKDATTWRPPILAMLAHAHDGEKGAVVDYMAAYLKGLANHGKIALPVAEILHKTFTSNVEGAIKYIMSKMPGAK